MELSSVRCTWLNGVVNIKKVDNSRPDSQSPHQETLVVGGEVVKVEANSLIPLAMIRKDEPRAHDLPTIQQRTGQEQEERLDADISYAYQTRKKGNYTKNLQLNCSQCGKGFVTKDKFNAHMSV
jgi:hypothetical protein